MRPTLLALLASAAIVSAGGCAQNDIGDLVAETSCGSVDAITKCLEASDIGRLDEIARCYSSNGCTSGETTVEAVWFAKDCQPLKTQNGRGDLKRRADSTDSESTTADQTTEKTTAKTTAKTTSEKTTAAKTTSTVASTEATTTSDSSTTSESSTSSSATTASSTTSSSLTSTTTGSTSTNSATTTGTLICSVTSTKQTSVCVSTSGTSSCVATTTEIASCAAGNICFTSTAGADICMKRDDSLTTSGLIVTIVFSLAIAAAAIAFTVMTFRNNAKVKQEERARLLAAATSKGGDVEAQPFSNRSEAALPLITPGGTRSEQTQYYNQPQQDYFGQGIGGGNSVTPPAQRGNAPQLHQGLGALGQERY
ncbi:hypothetical protein EG329_000995 [Mollisiaceae sp. DMI_Dod_QoI]|nr:hypothetical protein EG329_000995 [Helotiales sp. DMI_Dod_QoI]